MERVGLPGRIMLILMAALLLMIGVTAGLDHLARRNTGMAYPRLVHAAGIIALMRGADAVERGAIVRAATNNVVRVTIVDAPPSLGEDDIKAPSLQRRLRTMIGGQAGNVEAYRNRVEFYLGRKIEGHLTKVVAPLGDGRTLVIEWIDQPRVDSLTLIGLPPSAWAGILGFAVAGLALFTALREVRPLKMLTDAVTRFDGGLPTGLIEETGAPDVRRLVRAVRGMQERVAALLAERSFLIGAISHDLRTYLTRLRLRCECIADDDLRERTVCDLDAMTRLIDTSLAFARGTTSSQNRVALDLSDLVAAEVEEHRALGLPVTIEATYAGDAIVVGDPVALRRVVCNVLVNARDFARCAITVRVEHDAGIERVVVEDDGPGIPEMERRAVFSPFYRVERSRNRMTGGTGLGLAIARQIVEAHAGTIEAMAAHPHGAAFTIELPAVPVKVRPLSGVTKRHDAPAS